jgi:asparagine synthetase B (glutamine-hydrolysing)
VHHVAAASGCTTLDKVSAVDYLLNQTVCYPYSWYEDVRVVSPGAISVFSAPGVEQHTYWTPHEHDDLYRAVDERAWGERLGEQVERAVQQALDGKEKGRVMYSGGMDSRAIMSVIPDEFECIPTTVLDGGPGHREYELARRSAQWLGRRLEWIPRPEGYYRSAIEERIDTVGPGWDIRHTHIHGPVQRRFEDADVVFGGYLADTLFKTNYMSNVERQGGMCRSECLLDPTPDIVKRPDVQSEPAALWNDYAAAARERRIAHHERLKTIRPRTAGNWHSLWPLVSQRFTYPHYLINLRMNATLIEPFLFNQTYQLAARMPDPCRVNQKAFRHAFAERMGRAGYLPTSSGRIPKLSDGGVFGALAETAGRYLRGWPTIKRGIKRIVGGTYPGPQGPWHPDSNGWYPVQPEKHFQSKEKLELLEHRLNAILAKGQASRFFSEKELHPSLQVRALALGFAHPS